MDGFAWRVRSACGNIFLSAPLPACSLSKKLFFADDDKEAGSQTNSKQVKKGDFDKSFLGSIV